MTIGGDETDKHKLRCFVCQALVSSLWKEIKDLVANFYRNNKDIVVDKLRSSEFETATNKRKLHGARSKIFETSVIPVPSRL